MLIELAADSKVDDTERPCPMPVPTFPRTAVDESQIVPDPPVIPNRWQRLVPVAGPVTATTVTEDDPVEAAFHGCNPDSNIPVPG